MARRIRLDLMAAGGVQTGNGNSFDWPGGDGIAMCMAATGGTVGLQFLGPDGVTWINVVSNATGTAIALAAQAMANFSIGAGPVRAAAGVATGCVFSVVGLPINTAG